MLDTAIGPVISIISNESFKMNVTHIGTHNKFKYYNNETVLIDSNNTGLSLSKLVGKRVRCSVRYRDEFNRLFAEVRLE